MVIGEIFKKPASTVDGASMDRSEGAADRHHDVTDIALVLSCLDEVDLVLADLWGKETRSAL